MERTADIKAINKLFATYQRRFIRFAYSYVRDPVIAEDFAIEAISYYWEHRHAMEPDSNIPAYILTIIKHKCLNYLQHLQVEKDVESHLMSHQQWELQTRISSLEACEPKELFLEEVQSIARRTLEYMPEQTRKVFVMSRYENKSHKEIAFSLGITTKGVEFHISKALKLLKKNLKDYFPVFLYFF